MTINYPELSTLSSIELVNWCKQRKKTLGYSNQKLSEITGVPVGTIDRILSGNYTEYRYSSISPIIAALIGYKEETPPPDKLDETKQDYYYDTIQGYKLIVDNKNSQIDSLKRELEVLDKNVSKLEEDNKKKQEMIDKLLSHISWMENNK